MVFLSVVAITILGWLGWWIGTSPVNPSVTKEKVASHLPSQEEPAHAYSLHYKFDRTVFYSDRGRHQNTPRDRVRKWAGPVDVAIVGSTSGNYKTFVQKHLSELSRLTRLVFSLTENPAHRPTNFLVVIADRKAIDQALADMEVPYENRALNGWATCFALVAPEREQIVAAITAIPSEYPEETIRHCILEETTQALGLYADADMIQPSVFSERTHPSLVELPLNDKIIVRTLYDPRITPGMPRDEALEVAREVIGELVEGVRRHGVEALYQRPGESPHP
jgi:hypothetical protein